MINIYKLYQMKIYKSRNSKYTGFFYVYYLDRLMQFLA